MLPWESIYPDAVSDNSVSDNDRWEYAGFQQSRSGNGPSRLGAGNCRLGIIIKLDTKDWISAALGFLGDGFIMCCPS